MEEGGKDPAAHFGGATSGPLAPPKSPLRFGTVKVEHQSPGLPRPSVAPTFNSKASRSTKPPFFRPGSNAYVRGESFPRPPPPRIPNRLSGAGRQPGLSRPPGNVMQRPSSMVFNRINRVPSHVPANPPASLDQQREDEARAQRLQRFRDHAVVPEPKKTKPPVAKTFSDSMDVEDAFNDDRDWRTAEAVQGLCSDMCPESERAERERKGDLDAFERLDGDRNLSSQDLAVKKYTRTPEKDPNLIRPLHVLRTTMDYLLGLLKRPYGDDLLGLYNFLWDRMRAVRMDLRMQHIFNVDAIIMHEQMIRLHVLVMHELSEYPKGEGFVEGFDAHLNIEQMNKALAELFLMYEQHRQQGDPQPNESEFRSYYTLLKLDMHPGYMVEPSELTADLARMSPEMRNSTDILFALKVARSYRLPNYVAFFRLARSATYLQACLMHAHFSKLRTQALASLHSGLKLSQGIPLKHVALWLGMEKLEIEGLLEYHGFVIKQFEEPYVVKEGSFLNKDDPYTMSRSRLVEVKRSLEVYNDVVTRTEVLQDQVDISATASPGRVVPEIVDEDIPDYEEEMPETSVPIMQESPPGRNFAFFNALHFNFQGTTVPEEQKETPRFFTSIQPSFKESPRFSPSEFRWAPVVQPSIQREEPQTPAVLQTSESKKTSFGDVLGKRPRQPDLEDEDHLPKRHEPDRSSEMDAAADEERRRLEEKEKERREEESRREEALAGTMKLWFRRWKRRSDAKKEAARLRKVKAEAALSSMTLGLPVQGAWKIPTPGVKRIDLAQHVLERKLLWKNMWKYLDVLSFIAPSLKTKWPDESAICWKLTVCSGVEDGPHSHKPVSPVAGKWLRSKLLNDAPDFAKHEIAGVSTATYISSDLVGDTYYCYIAKDVGFSSTRIKFPTDLCGSSGILFLLLEDLSLEDNFSRLDSLVAALPSETALPLLMLSMQDVLPEVSLHLDRLGRSKISCWRLLPITGSLQNVKGFYSTDILIEGVQWLVSQAPLQPTLRAVNIRDLVGQKLQRLLENVSVEHASPESCISIFNRAIQTSMEEVSSTARNSRSDWPPPELGREAEGCFPRAGWNDRAHLLPIFETLERCKLPEELRWPSSVFTRQCSAEALLQDVRTRYSSMVDALASYLSDVNGGSVDHCELASLLLGESIRLDWTAERCGIVVDWLHIFGTIFHDRLMLLNSEPPAIVYVTKEARSEDVDGDDVYAEKLKLALRLRSRGWRDKSQYDVPDRIKEDVWKLALVEKQDNGTMAELETDVDSDMIREEVQEDARFKQVAQEIEYLRSQEHVRLLESARRPETRLVVFEETKEERRLRLLVAKFHEKVDRNLELASRDGVFEETKDELQLSIRDGKLHDNVEFHKPKDSSRVLFSRFDQLLSACQAVQTSNSAKLLNYFGLKGSES